MNSRETLKSLNIQYTVQRESILDFLKNNLKPQTINQIQKGLKTEVDLSTLYRTLELFEQKELIRKTELKEPLQNIYEYNQDLHSHHIICTQCKKVELIEDCPLHEYEAQVEKSSGYIVQEHQLNLYGICPQCQSISK